MSNSCATLRIINEDLKRLLRLRDWEAFAIILSDISSRKIPLLIEVCSVDSRIDLNDIRRVIFRDFFKKGAHPRYGESKVHTSSCR